MEVWIKKNLKSYLISPNTVIVLFLVRFELSESTK